MRAFAFSLSCALGAAAWALPPPKLPLGPSIGADPRATPAPPLEAIRFPEEASRDLWPAGCDDFLSLAGADAVRVKITKKDGRFTAFAAMKLRPEPGESLEALVRSVDERLRDVASYPKWVLPGINDRADGGSYFVSVDGLEAVARQKDRHYALTGPYTFRVLWFERSGASTLDVRLDEGIAGPDCPALRPAGTGLARPFFRMTPRPEIVEFLVAELFAVPRAAWVELHLRLALKPSRLVYELLGEGLVRSQVEARGRRIFANFVDLRRSGAVRGGASAASALPSPSAPPRAPGP